MVTQGPTRANYGIAPRRPSTIATIASRDGRSRPAISIAPLQLAPAGARDWRSRLAIVPRPNKDRHKPLAIAAVGSFPGTQGETRSATPRAIRTTTRRPGSQCCLVLSPDLGPKGSQRPGAWSLPRVQFRRPSCSLRGSREDPVTPAHIVRSCCGAAKVAVGLAVLRPRRNRRTSWVHVILSAFSDPRSPPAATSTLNPRSVMI